MAHKDELGRLGEQLAVEYLESLDYEIVERNWRCSAGEIDVVARDDDELVFVEVKTRAGIAYGHPLEAITVVKLARLRRLAGLWCEASETTRQKIRIDAIGVIARNGVSPRLEHVQRVF